MWLLLLSYKTKEFFYFIQSAVKAGRTRRAQKLSQQTTVRMSINGEITAVRISRRSSIADEELHDKPDYEYDFIKPDEDEKPRRPISGGRNRTSRPKTGRVAKHKETVDNSEHIMRADSDQINLEKLLHSMLDLNGSKSSSALRTQRPRPFSAHQLSSGGGGGIAQDRPDSVISDDSSVARRQRQRPFSAHDSQLRTNYSFSNDKVDQIDRENQRLLREILKNQAKKVPAKQPVFAKRQEPLKVKSSASLNRMRFQQQVERDNLVSITRGRSQTH